MRQNQYANKSIDVNVIQNTCLKNKYCKKRLQKKLAVIVLVFIAILSMNIKKINAINTNVNQTFFISVINNNEEIFSQPIDIKNKYNVLMIPMDVVFTQLFKEYNIDNIKQTLTYNDSTTLEVDNEKNIIKVPNIYDMKSSQINDSVDVEIELIDEIKYIPIYLLTNINGIEVYIDNKKVYDKNEYYSSIEALDDEKIEHTIEIKLNKDIEDKEPILTQYSGEEDGALWREEARKRIEKYRKSNVDIRVKNQMGKEVNNSLINLRIINNEFKFGTAIRMVESTKLNKYDLITKKLFNAIGSENGFKWSVLHQNGSAIPKDIINFGKEKNMYLRGHFLWIDKVYPELEKLIGNLEEPVEGTMAYIYNKYNSGELTNEETEEYIRNIQEDFENIVLEHIKEMLIEFPEIQEWDVINEPLQDQFFKYYIYEKKLLEDSKFASTKTNIMSKYNDNEEYYKFSAKCFDMAKEINENAKLILNDNKINGNVKSQEVKDTIRIIKNIKKYTNNIDTLGVQYHVNNRYEHTPQSYYNQINYALEQTGLKEAVITEYDNYTKSKLNKYTKEEREQKANYLRDTLIAQYSNPNVNGFYFWVYNSGTGSFVEEEWQAYEELMKEWLNDEQNGMTNTYGEYSTRLYKGEYTAKVQINDLKTEVPIKVTDNMEPIEIIINSNLEKILVKQKPAKTEYIQNEEQFDAKGGTILAYYDDGTTEEIDMNSSDVEISKLNNSILGKQTMTVSYKGKKVTFVVDIIEDVKEEDNINKEDEISSITIKNLPDKLNYIQNKEELNVKNGKILIINKDGTTKEISMSNKDVSITGFDNTILGEKAIRIKYKGLETTYVVNIIEDTSKQDTTLAKTILPNAGITKTIIAAIFVLSIIGIIYGKKYIQYLRDTHKQIK